jgi:hypothetical protein
VSRLSARVARSAAQAIETDAIDYLSAERIVEILLQNPR